MLVTQGAAAYKPRTTPVPIATGAFDDFEGLMGRTTTWAIAAALMLLPGAALAQAGAPVAATVVTADEQRAELAPGAQASPMPAPVARIVPTPGIGQPVPKAMDLQPSVTTIGDYGRWLNNSLLLPMMAAVTVFVLGLLGWTMFRFRASANPIPSKTSHNTVIEVVWTVVPVLLLVIVAVPSFRLLANQYDPPKPDVTIKAIGHQWYWEYQYPDHGGFSFDSVMLTDAEAAAQGSPRLLDVDNRVVVPAGATVKILTTAADVIHAFAMPAFWVKMDAVPGRINETWFKVDRPGVYFGQCSELCGTKHGFMPIAIEVLPPAEFNAWAAAKEAENGGGTPGPRFATGPGGKLVKLAAAPATPAAQAAAAPVTTTPVAAAAAPAA